MSERQENRGVLVEKYHLAMPTPSDRPIVYSARYYYPPDQAKRQSHWHLYRINPDGSGRRQITSGPFDDTEPRWSPDGRWIAFIRSRRPRGDGAGEGPSGNDQALCFLDAARGRVHRLTFADEGKVYDLRWEPRSRRIIGTHWRAAGGEYRPCLRAYPLDGGRSQPFPPESEFAVLPDGHTVRVDARRNELVVRDRPGAAVRRLALPQIRDMAPGWERPRTQPHSSKAILLPRWAGETTFGHYFVYRVIDLETGAIREAAVGKFLAFAPDGKRYVAVVRRDGAPYGPTKTVWVQPLEIGALGQEKTRPLVEGLVYVVGADWRGGVRR